MNTDALLIITLIVVVVLIVVVIVLVWVVLKLVKAKQSDHAILHTYLQIQDKDQARQQSTQTAISHTAVLPVVKRLERQALDDMASKLPASQKSGKAVSESFAVKPSASSMLTSKSFKSLSSEAVGNFDRPQNNGPTTQQELNPEYDEAMSLMLRGSPLFITGAAGTGKSTLLRQFLSKATKQCVVVAPTGMAAINVGGQTIHSFFQLPHHPLNPGDAKRVRNDQLYKAIDVIVIDEVSMVRSDVIDGIDEFMRLNGRDPNKPFGGVQIIAFGDLYQLPPIVKGKEQSKFFSEVYQSQFFFDAHVFDQMKLTIIELKKVYRQTNPTFIKLLNALRIGKIGYDQLEAINDRFDPTFSPSTSSRCVTLTPTRAHAGDINIHHLESLTGDVVFYEADATGEMAQAGIDGPNKNKDDDKLPADAVLRLKRNAQVMFLKNDLQKRWVNGTIGRVVGLEPDCVHVEITDGSHTYTYAVNRDKWSKLKYKYDHEKRRIESTEVGSFVQYPLVLAWAMTIHKSQGQTYDEAAIDFGESGAFADGQAYVALSRCRTLNGLRLKTRIQSGDIKVNPYIAKCAERLQRMVCQ